jgi:hypothetical protein
LNNRRGERGGEAIFLPRKEYGLKNRNRIVEGGM